ncbi:serine hydrolase domain-containing protein [Streptomyces lydicus]|uniref:serine hydrolase domain-containing protein n=1 Tax=Streptomyces lydicus TaxID=47763 RepID=UPI0036F1715B
MHTPRRLKRLKLGLTVGAAAGVTAVALVAANASGAPGRQGSSVVNAHAVRGALINAARAGGAPGGLALIADEYGWKYAFTIGEADIQTGREPHVRDRFRAGSITKMFVSTVILQLEAEHRLSIDDKVEKWLPGRVPVGSPITIRQLLQHTSGLPDFKAHLTLTPANRKNEYTPDQLLALIKDDKPDFPPGRAWQYSNTNYLLAGMIIDKVTGHDWRQEVERRIIKRQHLANTWAPGKVTKFRGPHMHGYDANGPEPKELVDVTELSPTMADSAGEMISNAEDATHFLRSLLGGELLPVKQLAEMKAAVPAPALKGGYGLGLMRTDLKCGISVWGHGGLIPGFNSWAAVNEDGSRTLVASVNKLIEPQDASTQSFYKLMEASFCKKK